MKGLGFGVWSLEFRVEGVGFESGLEGLGCSVQD